MALPQSTNAVLAGVSIFSDAHSPEILYGEFKLPKGETVFAPIDDSRFKYYVRYRIRRLKIKGCSVNDVLEDIREHYSICANAPAVTPAMRTSGDIAPKADGTVKLEYDLNNSAQQVVEVTPNGWKITTKPESKFLSSKLMLAQVTPIATTRSPLDLLKQFVNLTGDSYILFVVWLIQAFSAGIRAGLLIIAQRGSGKTHLCKNIIRAILDPSKLGVNSPPSKYDDLITTLANSNLVVFDNLRSIPPDQSDALACSITGAMSAKRELFTTCDLSVRKLQNIVVLNGITLAIESDLAERCILLKLSKLSGTALKPEKTMQANLDKAMPEILGSIFNTISEAMRVYPTLNLATLPRMSDAFEIMAAVAKSLGVSEAEFYRIYNDNVAEMARERMNTPLVEAIVEYMNSVHVKGRFTEGTVSSVYTAVKATYSGDKQLLPRSPSAFSRQLRSERDTLEVLGYDILIDTTYANATHVKIIKSK